VLPGKRFAPEVAKENQGRGFIKAVPEEITNLL
jgi:hypothetical protein